MKKSFFVAFCIFSLIITIFLTGLCIVVPIMYAIEVPAIWYIALGAWIIIDLLNVKNREYFK